MTGRVFLRDSFTFALSQYVSRAMLLARGLVAAAALGPTGFGAWNALILILDYGAYSSLGTIDGLNLQLPPAVARDERVRALRALRGAWWGTLAGAVVFGTGVVAYLRAGTWLALTGWGWGPPILMLVAVLLQLAIHYHTATLRAHADFRTVSAALAIQAVVGGGIGLLTVWRAGVWGLLWGWLIGGVLALAWLRRSPHRPPLAPAFPAEAVALARAGFPLFAFFALMLMLRSLDRIALVRFGGNQALGQYSLGLIAAGLVLYLPEAAAAVLFPRIAAAAEGARDPGRTRVEVVRAQRVLMALLPLPVALGALWAAPVVTRVLPAFEGGIPALRILLLGALLTAGATLPAHYLMALGRGRSLLAPGAGAVLGAGLLLFGVASRMPWATAVAVASALGQGLFAVVMLTLASRTLAGDAGAGRGLVVGTLVPALWAAVLALALAAVGGGGAAAATWHSAVFVAAYAPALLLFGRGLGLRRALREWLLPA